MAKKEDTQPANVPKGDAIAAYRADPSDGARFNEARRAVDQKKNPALAAELYELRASYVTESQADMFAEAAALRMNAGDAAAGEANYRRALEADPGHSAACTAFREYLIEQGRYAEAAAVLDGEVGALDQAADADKPDNVQRLSERHAQLAKLWEEHLGRVERALTHWQRAWQLAPERTEALAAARDIYASLGDDKMVIRLYEAELDVIRDSGDTNRRAEIAVKIARLRNRLGDHKAATARLEEALELQSTSDEIREELAGLYASPAFAEDDEARKRGAQIFVSLGKARMTAGHVEEAIRFLRRALGVDPYSVEVMDDLEAALSAAEKWQDLDRLYAHRAGAIADDQQRVELLRRRIALYAERLVDREAYKEALAELVAIEGPWSPSAASLKGTYREDEDWQPLADLLAKGCEELEPGSAEYSKEMLELATIERERLRHRERAAEIIHKVLQHDSQHAEALARYADHFRERRDWRGLADLEEFAVDRLKEQGAPSAEVVRRLEELALLYERRLGDVDRSAGAWKRIAELEPNSAKAAEAMKRLAARAKTWQSLIGVLEHEAEAAQSPEHRAEVLKRIAQTLRERHFNPRRAISLLEEVLGLFPDDVDALKSLAELYDREGDDAGLAKTIRRQLDLDSKLLDGEVRASSGRAPTSREWPVAKRVERLNQLRRLASMYESKLADTDGVVFACSGVLEILPGDRDALSRMERVLEAAEDFERLEQILDYHAAAANGPAERAKVLRRLARLAADRGDEVATIERWEQVLSTAPNDRDALEALISLYDRHERWDDLAAVLERRVIQQRRPEPGTPEAAALAVELRRYAQVVDRELEDPARATKAWSGLRELLPLDREALAALARLYESAGHWRDLEEVLGNEMKLFIPDDLPRAADLALKRASILEDRLGAQGDAIKALEQLIAELDPTNLAAHKALRRLFEARGAFEAAVRIAEREIYLAEETSQKIARGLEIGFLCRDRLGDDMRALQAFERVLELDAEHGEALAAAADLYAKVGRWKDYADLLAKQVDRAAPGRERRALMVRIASVTAEQLGDFGDAFTWYRRAHNHAPDPSTLANLRRSAEAYGLWSELLEVYEDERAGLLEEDGAVSNVPAYVETCREIADVAERHLKDPKRAMAALRDAIAVTPQADPLVSEAERIARATGGEDLWRAYLECTEIGLPQISRTKRVTVLLHRAQILEEEIDDREEAAAALLQAFSWLPNRREPAEAIYKLAERTGRWDDVVAIESARFERAGTLEQRVALLRRQAEVVEEKMEQPVRAFRLYLSAFLLSPEDQETLAHLWRLARAIGTYSKQDRRPEEEPPAAAIEPPEVSQTPRKPPASVRPREDRTMEISISDLLVASPGSVRPLPGVAPLDEDTVDDGAGDEVAEDTEIAEIPPPSREDRTQPLDLNDLEFAESAQKHSRDPTMPLRAEDLIDALAVRPKARPRRVSAPPPVPPASLASPPPPPTRRRPAPRMPVREYASPWDELSSAYELLPTSSPTMKLRWLFRSAEVQELGAEDVDAAFSVLARALELATDPSEAKDRLYRLAEAHDAWERLASMYEQAAEEARRSEEAVAYLFDIAEIRAKQGRSRETESIYRRILGMRPDDERARTSLETLYRAESRWVDLAASLEERTDPRLGSAAPEAERPALLRELASVYDEKLSRPHDAIDALVRLQTLEPEDTEVLRQLADLYSGLGRWSKVVDSLTRLADIAQGASEARIALKRIADTYENQLELGDRAIDAYNQILAMWPDDTEAYAALDRLFLAQGRWEDLAQVLRRRAALESDSEVRADLLRRRAEILLEWLDSPDEAAAALQHARTLAPQHDGIGEELVVALTQAGRAREAVAILEGRVEALRAAPQTSAGKLAAQLIRLGSMRHEVLGDRGGARALIDEALELVPNHPTALAARARLAKDEQDPRAYVEALLHQVDATDDEDGKVEGLMEAGRVLRDDCEDIASARECFERVLQLRPYHADATWSLAGLVEQSGDFDSAAALLNHKLEDESLEPSERARILTQLAALARQAGVDAVAEMRLNEALQVSPGHVAAIIAKADVLDEVGRLDDLVHFLETTIAELEDAPAQVLAALRRRLASAFESLERSDEAYQLLLEADRLHRGDVLIKLALGENRYRARRWREAALHLSALADHPEGERYAAEVAEGLYHAALSEIRTRRPERAQRLYERALELRPSFAPALHALAELVMEQGDSQRAAELLTRQAEATTDAKEKLRMFEALGDMALLSLSDSERALKCYESAVQAADPLEQEHVPLLAKLLKLQQEQGDHGGAARSAELLSSFSSSAAERAERLTLAARSYMEANESDKAVAAVNRALDASPSNLNAVDIGSALAFEQERYADALKMLARALTVKGIDDDELTALLRATLWSRLGEARRQQNDQPGAVASFERAIAIAPDSKAAMSARRHLLSLWQELDATQSRLVAYQRAVAASSSEVADILDYGRALATSDHFDGASVVLRLARELGAELSEEDLVFLRGQPMRVMAPDEAYHAVLNADIHRRLMAETDFRLMTQLMTTLWGAASLIFSDTQGTLLEHGLSSAERLGSSSVLPAAAMFTRIANALSVPAALLYHSPELEADFSVLCASPPIVVLGASMSRTGKEDGYDEDELRFILGRAVELARPENIIAAGLSVAELELLLRRLEAAFGSGEDVEGAKELKTTLPVRLREPIVALLQQATGADLDPASYREVVQRRGDRAGFLVAGDPSVALRLTRARKSREGDRHLVELALRPEFLEARAQLGVGVLR